MEKTHTPEVQIAGRRMLRSLAAFTRACEVTIAEEQKKLAPDTALIALLCDAVRLARECEDDHRVML
jgi:hypothetical protein